MSIRTLSRTRVGFAPVGAAQDQQTETLYVTNSSDGSVSVIDMTRCNSHDVSGCAKKWPSVVVGRLPLGIAVDQATDTIYVTNADDDSVSVINGATCNAANTSGCNQQATTVRTGAFDNAVAVDPVTNTVFVTNQDAQPGTVSVIDGNSCTGSHPSGCAQQPFTTIEVGGGPSGVEVNPVTNTIYVANTAENSNNVPVPDGDTLSVIDGATCRATDQSRCASIGAVRVGADPADLAIDPGTNSLYVANTYDNTNSGTGTVSVVNGSNCDASNASGCASQVPPQVPVGADPVSAAVDMATHTVFVTNFNGNAVSVINVARCNAVQISGCKGRPPAVAVGTNPTLTVVNIALHTSYEVEQGSNDVAVLSTD